MKLIKSITQLQRVLQKERKGGKTLGFVPTMGYFHEGHLSLLRRARKENDIVIVSIYVNPTQFGPHEDFSHYPRDLKRDCRLARTEKVDYMFYPVNVAMYPPPYLSYVNVEKITDVLCGLYRPDHFRGVTTIVCKLFNIVQPDRAYFGQKDYQQFVVIKQMVRDLNIAVSLRLCPIVREKDGLAMSSRNVYLKPYERERARGLYQSLSVARHLIAEGERDPQKLINAMKRILEDNIDTIDYIAILTADTLEAVNRIQGKLYIGVAAYVGVTRLIDNIIVKAR